MLTAPGSHPELLDLPSPKQHKDYCGLCFCVTSFMYILYIYVTNGDLETWHENTWNQCHSIAKTCKNEDAPGNSGVDGTSGMGGIGVLGSAPIEWSLRLKYTKIRWWQSCQPLGAQFKLFQAVSLLVYHAHPCTTVLHQPEEPQMQWPASRP